MNARIPPDPLPQREGACAIMIPANPDRRRRDRAQRRPRRRSSSPSPTPATGRSRSARTITSSRPTRRCKFDRAARARLPPRHRGRHRRALRARARSGRSSWSRWPATASSTASRRGDGTARRAGGEGGKATAATRPRTQGTAKGDAMKITRRAYAEMFGPTIGDRVRLADTDLVIEVERDLTDLRRGGEVRRRQGDPRRHGPEPAAAPTRGRRHRDHQRADRRLDWGIVKGDIGIKDGRIAASARPAIPTSSRASTSSSARAPRSSPARA